MTEAANIAADFIGTLDAKLAKLFIAQPFNRLSIAKAFAKGLINDKMEMGKTIIDLAEMDRQERLEANAELSI